MAEFRRKRNARGARGFVSEAAKVYPGIFRVSEDGEETALVQIRASPFMLSKSGRTKVT